LSPQSETEERKRPGESHFAIFISQSDDFLQQILLNSVFLIIAPPVTWPFPPVRLYDRPELLYLAGKSFVCQSRLLSHPSEEFPLPPRFAEPVRQLSRISDEVYIWRLDASS
jgi:hypothetical protein